MKFLSIQHYYFFLEHEKFQLIDYKKISSIQLFFIYTTIASTKNGIILVDEIENGVYFKNYEYLWYLVDEFSSKNNTQVFITSHSKECILAASDIIKEKYNEYSLIQMYMKNGASHAVIRDSKAAIEAMANGIELR